MRKYATVTNGVGDDDECAYFRKDEDEAETTGTATGLGRNCLSDAPVTSDEGVVSSQQERGVETEGFATIIEMRNAPAVDLAVELLPDAAAGETMMEQVSVVADDERFEPSRSTEANFEASSKVKSVVCSPSVPSNGGVKPKRKKDEEEVTRRWMPLLRRSDARKDVGAWSVCEAT